MQDFRNQRVYSRRNLESRTGATAACPNADRLCTQQTKFTSPICYQIENSSNELSTNDQQTKIQNLIDIYQQKLEKLTLLKQKIFQNDEEEDFINQCFVEQLQELKSRGVRDQIVPSLNMGALAKFKQELIIHSNDVYTYHLQKTDETGEALALAI